MTENPRAKVIECFHKLVKGDVDPNMKRITFSATAIHVYTPDGWFELKPRKMKEHEMIWLGPEVLS